MNLIYTNLISKILHYFPPFLKIFLPIILLNEILDLHLFKFSITKDKIARRNLVSKSLAHLSNTKRQGWMMGIDCVFKINENTLRSLRAQIRSDGLFSSANNRFENFITKVRNMT